MMAITTTIPTIVLAASTAGVLLLLSSFPPFTSSQPAYSQLPTTTNLGSQNLSSLLKNLLRPEKDVSGHYSNPQFGIADIVFPDGWHGRELPPIVGLTVIMHPGNENKSSSPFGISLPPPFFTQPQMTLQVINNSELAALSSEGGGGGNPRAFSISKNCKPLAQNTTSVIDGKTFNVATVECPLSSLMRSAVGNNENISNSGAAGIFTSRIFKSLNPNAVMQAKLYEFKGPDKTYRLAIFVSNLFSPSSQSSEKPDITKYTQLIDTTANTLKFR
jgi:hypothetical protein